MYEWIADQFLHFGWALQGQECDCGHNHFNWLARKIGEGKYNDDFEPVGFSVITWGIGDALVNIHNRMMTD